MPKLSLIPERGPHESLPEWRRRARRVRRVLQIFGAVVFAAVMTIEMLEQLQANPIYLFAMALTLMLVLVGSDAITTRIEVVEYEERWSAVEGATTEGDR